MGYQRVVAGTDGSESAAGAVAQAADMAKSFAAELLIVTAYVGESSPGWETEGVPDDLQWQVTDAAMAEEHAVKAAQIAAEAGVAGSKMHTISEKGDPADALVRVAEERNGDLIVIGSKGMHSASRFPLGSVPNKVSHHAGCDMMTVRTV